MTEQFREWINRGCDEISVSLSDEQTEQFYHYYELLMEWNRVMNLTSIIELKEVVEKHFLDSLLLVQAFPDIRAGSLRCVDVGTGAGFPGIPLKIAFPELTITLLDSLNKRVRFLKEVIEKLALHQIDAVHGRAEDFGRNPTYREQFDLCVSRAVANMSTLSEYCLPFVRIGGYFISYKSGNVEEEAFRAKTAVEKLGGRIMSTDFYVLPGTDVDRAFVCVKKERITSKKFPRKAGTPGKEPL